MQDAETHCVVAVRVTGSDVGVGRCSQADCPRVRHDMENRSSPGYMATDRATDGAWREVAATRSDARPELQDLTIRARNAR